MSESGVWYFGTVTELTVEDITRLILPVQAHIIEHYMLKALLA
jgi:hypothetical protein